MPYAQTKAARIYYETRGRDDGLPVLLIEGFGVQMNGWREGFLAKLVGRGLRPVLFDNRDTGLSQKFGGPDDHDGHYRLDDLAEDSFGVLDALGLPDAHVVGQSMGGMIAQIMAVRRPERVRSLSLIYTAPGTTPYLKGRRRPEVAGLYAYREREQAINLFVEREKMARSTAYPFDEVWAREWAERSFARCYAPDGVARQAAALRRLPEIFEGLERIARPTLVLHGRADQHIAVGAAFELGRRIETSEVHVYPGLGHEVAEALWDEWATLIERTARRGETPSPTGRGPG